MNEILIGVIMVFFTAFIGVGGYFAKHMLERMDTMNDRLANMEPKVDALWEHFIYYNGTYNPK